ncbi:MAG: crossover junction endodeoxyribonuclease RuvC [Fidelibacterota bacterium]
MRRILGIDPGIRTTGYGILQQNDEGEKVIAWGTLSPPRGQNLYQRLVYLYDGITQIILEHRPSEMAIEEAFFSKNARTALTLGQARGVVLLAAAHQNIDCFEYSPRKIKLAVVGNGNASKTQVQYMVKSLLSLGDSSTGTAIPSGPKSFDVTDALATALCHINQNRESGWRRR